MKLIKDSDAAGSDTIGRKAHTLFRLKKLGLPVPDFVVIPVETIQTLLTEILPDSYQPQESVNKITFPDTFFSQLLAALPAAQFFAVRSSSLEEDGTDFSFAGQFESHLFVSPENLAGKILSVWNSACSQRVTEYRRHLGLNPSGGIAIIVQEMIVSEVSGVAFGVNPLNGHLDEKVINAVYGLGEGLVSGALNADEYVIKNGQIDTRLALKTQQLLPVQKKTGGTVLADVPPALHNAPTLTHQQIEQLAALLDHLREAFGQPQDIEFAYQSNKLFLLQARPVTALDKKSVEKKDNYILWDNSNIIESYPGVTTPLTFSFITSSYQGAYSRFSAYLGVSKKVLEENRHVFANTLGLLNGRVYYNLRSWYLMLAMLPGYSLNARYMENMMGVKERFDIPDNYLMTKGKARWRLLLLAISMLNRYLSLPRQRREFMKLIHATISRYKAIDFTKKDAQELMAHYLDFEKNLLDEWKAPLLNDFFAMIWFGILQKQCVRYFGQLHPNIHNDLLCGSSDIISVEPVHRTGRLADQIIQNPVLNALFCNKDEEKILWEIRRKPSFSHFAREFDRYIADFGERCVGELKLETISYAQEPKNFVRVLKSYVESGITHHLFSTERESQIRKAAEQKVANAKRGRILAKWWLNLVLRKTRELVSARENLRYERTRAFGMVRVIFTELGKRLYQNSVLAHERDIFYLTKEEISAYIDGRTVTQDLDTLVTLRKKEFAHYQESAAPPERFATYGIPYQIQKFPPPSARKTANPTELHGVGCSPGRVTGKVRIVLDPNEILSLNGDILVTHSTDPGWVMLFPGAGGILVERGSLLSHSAIVSREMGKPCIVGITGLLQALKTGDEIGMDGATGKIRILTA